MRLENGVNVKLCDACREEVKDALALKALNFRGCSRIVNRILYDEEHSLVNTYDNDVCDAIDAKLYKCIKAMKKIAAKQPKKAGAVKVLLEAIMEFFPGLDHSCCEIIEDIGRRAT